MTNEHPRARDSSGTFANYSQTKTHTRAKRIHLLYVVKNARVIDGGSGDGGGAAAVATVATAAGVGEIYERKMAACGRAPNT